ncbi:hypothetical protein B0T16DRAFT_390028 [Cercophora newfieldiana]|uniref:Uncharacterized protein n=1 Tax=Cercophora newfieldiana TaxID=92897 RepID=A0AA39Y4S9_9PEZI|nr:hypothetical protein B0T16DRAFT_390028 [Cercophora newfieldiana]
MASPRTLTIAIPLCLCWSPASASTVNPTYTLPPPDTTYVATPNVRSSMSIFWNCVSILLLCTWSIQHLNVPPIRQRDDGAMGTIRQAMQNAGPKLNKWTVLTILFPEYLLSRAFGDRLSAHGYFVLDMGENWAEAAGEMGIPGDGDAPNHTISLLINMSRLRHRYWALNGYQWVEAAKQGLAPLPDIPAQHLERISSSGVLTKAFALIQGVESMRVFQ